MSIVFSKSRKEKCVILFKNIRYLAVFYFTAIGYGYPAWQLLYYF